MKPILRKVYTKKGSNSLIFNIPLDYANDLNLQRGDYLTVDKENDKLIIKKTEFKEGA